MPEGLFTVYRSSAGSGKTFTLVREYLRIVLSEPERYRHILGITFTNKAAAEMKSRILKNLKELASPLPAEPGPTHTVMLPMLMAACKLDQEEIRERSSRVLELILHHYDDFAITTVDSFMHRVIRTFTFDLKLPAGFEVEMETGALLKQATDLLISRAGSDEVLTHALIAFSESRVDDEKSYHIENAIHQLAVQVIPMEESPAGLRSIGKFSLPELLGIRHRMLQKQRAFEKRVVQEATDALALISDRGISDSDFFQGSHGIGAWFRKLASGDMEKLFPGVKVSQSFEEEKYASAKASAGARAALEEIGGELKASFERLKAIRDEGWSAYVILGRICDQFYPIALLNELNLILNEIKSREKLVLINEFNHILSSVVAFEPVPFIYERLGVRFRHFLFDEFQDNSILQWNNLLPLLDNGLSESHFSMLVGDGKQSIYRWRNGEVELFSALPDLYRRPDHPVYLEREAALKRNFMEMQLNENFRSAAEIVDFNNRLFGFIAERLGPRGRLIYRNHSQECGRKGSAGSILMDFNAELSASERLIAYVKDCVQDGFRLPDIAVICRSNAQAGELATALMRDGIPVVSSESLLLSASPSVQLLLAFAAAIHYPSDLLAAMAVIRGLHLRGFFKGKELHTCFEGVFESPSSDETGSPGLRLMQFLNQYEMKVDTARLRCFQAYDFFRELIRITAMEDDQDPYLQFFMDAVYSYLSKGESGSSGFLKWWEDNSSKLSVVIPEGTEAVHVMTIHKSKGLEFPVVIHPHWKKDSHNTLGRKWVPFSDTDFPGFDQVLISTSSMLKSTDYEWVYEEETEKSGIDFINMIYVATTRAADRLILLLEEPSSHAESLRSLSDIIAEYLRSDGSWEAQKKVYVSGRVSKYDHAGIKAPEPVFHTVNINTTHWNERIRLRYTAPSYWESDAPDFRREWGQWVHRALSECKTAGDVPGVIVEMQRQGVLNQEQAGLLGQHLDRLFQHPVFRDLFETEGEVLNETAILDPSGASFRPDRIVLSGDQVIVVDYKTGKPAEEHKDQLKQYSALLREMGYQKVSSYLVYAGDEIRVEELA